MKRKIIAVCHESSTKYINALRGESEQLLNPSRVANTEIQRDKHTQIRPNFTRFGIRVKLGLSKYQLLYT